LDREAPEESVLKFVRGWEKCLAAVLEASRDEFYANAHNFDYPGRRRTSLAYSLRQSIEAAERVLGESFDSETALSHFFQTFGDESLRKESASLRPGRQWSLLPGVVAATGAETLSNLAMGMPAEDRAGVLKALIQNAPPESLASLARLLSSFFFHRARKLGLPHPESLFIDADVPRLERSALFMDHSSKMIRLLMSFPSPGLRAVAYLKLSRLDESPRAFLSPHDAPSPSGAVFGDGSQVRNGYRSRPAAWKLSALVEAAWSARGDDARALSESALALSARVGDLPDDAPAQEVEALLYPRMRLMELLSSRGEHAKAREIYSAVEAALERGLSAQKRILALEGKSEKEDLFNPAAQGAKLLGFWLQDLRSRQRAGLIARNGDSGEAAAFVASLGTGEGFEPRSLASAAAAFDKAGPSEALFRLAVSRGGDFEWVVKKIEESGLPDSVQDELLAMACDRWSAIEAKDFHFGAFFPSRFEEWAFRIIREGRFPGASAKAWGFFESLCASAPTGGYSFVRGQVLEGLARFATAGRH
jgi:hypothetical protein